MFIYLLFLSILFCTQTPWSHAQELAEIVEERQEPFLNQPEIMEDTGLSSNSRDSKANVRDNFPSKWYEDLFGDSLYMWGRTKDGKTETAIYQVSIQDLLNSKRYIGVYFSASWCPPCRKFTPELSKFYVEKYTNSKDKQDLEIIWVSSDRSDEDFYKYFAKMPWLAVPFPVASSVLQKLAPKYKVEGIPYLVILDGTTGEIVTLDGLDNVLNDPYGLSFPWKGRGSHLVNTLRRFASVTHLVTNAKAKIAKIASAFLNSIVPKSILDLLSKLFLSKKR